MATARAPKKPWIAALLALVLGGPGCFYLGWRRGVVGTLGWMFALPLPLVGVVTELARGQDETLEFAIMFLFLIQAALAWLAYRSCKRTNAEAAKMAESPESDPIQNAQVKCVKEIRNTGAQVSVLSAITLFEGVILYVNTSPPMGELGHFTHGFAPVLMAMSIWGVATGIGLRRAYRWAWISMLVFGGLLTAACTLPMVPCLLMWGGGVDLYSLLGRVAGVLIFLPLAGIGFWWFSFFLRANVKSYFGIRRKAPEASA
jgi:cbb3-type cytochrome oxidase subunit 3